MKLALFVPFHRADWTAAVLVSALGLLHKAFQHDPVTTFQVWLRACSLKKLRMVGPVHVTIHLLRVLKLDVREDGSASDGVSSV
eukprot:4796567-Amphidinium_carterae.1